MTAQAAAAMGMKVCVYTDVESAPATQVAQNVIVGKYTDKKALKKFADSVDVVTFEFENIPYETITAIEEHVPVYPSSGVLQVAQHRLREKDFVNELGIGTAAYRHVKSASGLKKAVKEIGPHCILKTLEMGYDGKGQWIIDENSKLDELWKSAGLEEAILEQFVTYEKEISVVITRGIDGGSIPYMPVENIHKDGILDTTIAPAQVDDATIENAWNIAHDIAESLQLVGVLAVEMFLTKDGELLVNELAPRPHNSGHWTLDACITSQFEQLVRAVCHYPLGSCDYHSMAVMKNLVGEDINLWHDFVADPNSKIHVYGKDEVREGRKMGHVTHLLAPDDQLLESE
jgi:5-(carboxyamino)imidazole ribonucleotide synthase